MKILAIQSVYLTVADLKAVAASYERIGLRLMPGFEGGRTLAIGGPTNLFEVHLAPDDARTGLQALELAVDDLAELGTVFTERAIPFLHDEDQDGPLVWVGRRDDTGTELVFRQSTRQAERAGWLAHTLPLRRLDHLASVAADLAPAEAFWTGCLGIPLFGEVRTPTMVVRQFKIGDAIFELLGAVDATSPVWQRPQGLLSMASWEVVDLDAVVAQVRQAGFTPSDPAPGALPGTRVATVSGAELGGMNMQLLEYITPPSPGVAIPGIL